MKMNFLDRLNISKKLYVLIAIPALMLTIYAMENIYRTYSDMKSYEGIKELTSLSIKISNTVHETQKERGMSAGFIGSNGIKFKSLLPSQRAQTDKRVSELLESIKNSNSSHFNKKFDDNLANSINMLKQISTIRAQVDSLSISSKDMISYYTNTNAKLLDNVAIISSLSTDSKISNKLNGYLNFLLAKEKIGVERAVGANTLAAGSYKDGMKNYFVTLIAQQEAFLKIFSYFASDEIYKTYNTKLNDPTVKTVTSMEKTLLSKNDNFNIDVKNWFDAITYKINKFKELENSISSNLQTSSNSAYENTSSKLYAMLIANLLIFISMILLTTTIAKRISRKVGDFQAGLSEFIAYIAKEKDSVEPLKVNGTDEFANMTAMMNTQIEKISKIIEQDKKVVAELEDVVLRVSNGFFSSQVELAGASNEVEHLRVALNKMILSTKEKFNELISLLNNFAQSKFDYEIPEDKLINFNGDFGAVISSAKLLSDNSSELFAVIQDTGSKLNNSTNILSSSSQKLSNSSQSQKEALNRTKTVLEHMKEITNGSIQDIRKSSVMADNLSKSSQKGLDLASKTADASDEINAKVEAIDEAITIIDQIAFQTNILSLNAAVEAATAGEAGKGFSVVAQEVRNLATKSAEAASEIKELIESAKVKAQEGKSISHEMIDGYNQLSNDIKSTKNIMESLSKKSEVQEKDMIAIDDASKKMESVVKENEKIAKDIHKISTNVTSLASGMFKVVSSASYKPEVKEYVCDLELNSTISQMKHKHLMFKTSILSKLGSKNKFSVTKPTDCALGLWMRDQVSKGKRFTNSTAWDKLTHDHNRLHQLAQDYVDGNADGADNNQLELISSNLENSTRAIFNSLDGLKRANCDNKQSNNSIQSIKKESLVEA
jgi:methyl-accepting chemotaxis protein